MYTYISSDCLFDAQKHDLTEYISDLAKRVESYDYQEFSANFDMFLPPFYVKKRINYNYRLLTKLTQVAIDDKKYDVVVFFKIFARGDKDYNLLSVKEPNHYYGESLYKKQKLEADLQTYIHQRLTETDSQPLFSTEQAKTLLYKAKQNILTLSTHHAIITLEESTTWRYDVCPFLNQTQRQQIFEQLQNGNHQLDLQGQTLNFYPTPTPRIGEPNDGSFARHLPKQVLISPTLWLTATDHSFPFYLNEFQDRIVQKLFYTPDSFPLIVDSPSNTGKTSLLAMLYVHFNLQQAWQTGDFVPCLLICQPNEKSALHQQITHYTKFLHAQSQDLQAATEALLQKLPKLLPHTCTDLGDWLMSGLTSSEKEQFPAETQIQQPQFKKLFQKHHDRKTPAVNAHLYWTVIQFIIKGGQDKYTLHNLSDTISPNDETLTHIDNDVWQKWYQPLTTGKNAQFWDIHDLLTFVQQKHAHTKYASLLVDDAHTLSHLGIDVLLKACAWQEQSEQLSTQIPLIFMGNSHKADTLNLYAWQDELTKHLYHFYQCASKLPDIAPISHQMPRYLDEMSHCHFIDFLVKLRHHTAQDGNHTRRFYLLDKQNTQALHALIGSHIAIILNTWHTNHQQYLKGKIAFLDLCNTLHAAKTDTRYYGKDCLPPKSYAVALLGFFHDNLTNITQGFQNEHLDDSLISRTWYVHTLLKLHQVISQGLKKVFIVGDVQELPFWSAYFQQNISIATLDDIDARYLHRQQQLATKTDIAKAAKDFDCLAHIAQTHYQTFDYSAYGEMVRYIYHHDKTCQDVSSFAHTPKQTQFLWDHLWEHQQIDALLSFKNFPTDSLGSLYALQIYKGLPLKDSQLAITTALKALDTEQKNFGKKHLWQLLFPAICELIQSQQNASKHFYQYCQSVLISLNYHPSWHVAPAVLGFLAYHHGNFAECQAYYAQDTAPYPELYYQAKLQTCTDWQEQLLCHIALNHKETVMNMFYTQDLNELQAMYWDKLLPYLSEDKEFEQLIRELLPEIHSQSILDKLVDYCQDNASENFNHRLERFMTVRACLSGDLVYVLEKLKGYVPADINDAIHRLALGGFKIQVNQRKTKSGSHKTPQKIPDEVGDILHGLNFCPALKVCQTQEEYAQYAQMPHIDELFTTLRKMFSHQANHGHYPSVSWNTGFSMSRYLLVLLEKSPNPFDPIVAYSCLLDAQNGKTPLSDFALERLSILMNSAAIFDENNEPIIDETHQKQFAVIQQEFKKLIKNAAIVIPDDPYNLHHLGIKSKEDRIGSILALTNQENTERQRAKQAAIKAQKDRETQEKLRAEKERQQAERQLKREREYEKSKQERQERERKEKERKEQERLQQERLEQERKEQERKEKERLEQEQAQKAQLEKERLEQERKEQERLEQERLAQEKLAQEQVQEQARLAQGLAQDLTQECQNQNLAPTPPVTPNPQQEPPQQTPTAAPMLSAPIMESVSATCELTFFCYRVFFSRLYQRFNVENLQTGERWSLHLPTGQVQSDWHYQTAANVYHLMSVPLSIYSEQQQIRLHHRQQGAWLMVDL